MDLITSLGEAVSSSGCKQQKQSVQLQLKGMYGRNMVWLPDSTEKLEASERAGALGIQAAGIGTLPGTTQQRSSVRSPSASVGHGRVRHLDRQPRRTVRMMWRGW